jgi:DnaD/phage-associated family protein
MAWIELHETLPEHKKIYALMDELKVDQLKAIGIVTRLWLWAIRQAGDGDLAGYPPKAIANAIGWKKSPKSLFDGLVEAGFVDIGEGTCALHDWDDYAGRLIEKRAQNAERMRTSRARAKNVQGTSRARAGATVPNQTVPNYIDDDEEDARARAKLRLHEYYTEHFGTSPTPATVESLCMWLERFPLDVVQEAVHRAALANPTNPAAYIYEVLRNWYAGGHRTLLDIQGAEADRDMAQGRI